MDEPRLQKIRVLDRWKVWLRFADGSEGEVDLSNVAGRGQFKRWDDDAFWRAATIDPETGTLCWPGGIDLDPHVLYHEVTGAPLPGQDSDSLGSSPSGV